VKEGKSRGNDQDKERHKDREERGERDARAKDGKRESDKEARSSRGREETRRSESMSHEEGKRRRDRSRSRHRESSEGSREDSGRGKKERRFREEKANPKDTDTSTANTATFSDSPLPKVVEELAAMVAVSGEELEEAARSNSSRAADLDFLEDQSSALYMRFRARVAQLKSDSRQEGKRKRKSRWGAQESPVLELVPGGPGLALPTALGTVVAPALTRSTERSPAMKAYAAKIFGGVELTEDQWKHCEIQLQMNTLMTSKPVGVASNLDEGGTWEHKLRQAEIERTAGSRWHESDQQADDDPPISHHISHFLPPEEMAKFMQKQKVWIVQAILCMQCFQYYRMFFTSLWICANGIGGKLGVKSESFGFDGNENLPRDIHYQY